MHEFVVQMVGSIQTPDKIHVCLFVNVLVADEVVYFGEQHFHIIAVRKPVLTSGPRCCGDHPVSNSVPYKSWLIALLKIFGLAPPVKCLNQLSSASVWQGFLKHAIPGCWVRGTDLFSLRWSNKKMTTATTTIAIGVNESKSHLFFVRLEKIILFGVLQNSSN